MKGKEYLKKMFKKVLKNIKTFKLIMNLMNSIKVKGIVIKQIKAKVITK